MHYIHWCMFSISHKATNLCEIYLCKLFESSADNVNLCHINFYRTICYNAKNDNIIIMVIYQYL